MQLGKSDACAVAIVDEAHNLLESTELEARGAEYRYITVWWKREKVSEAGRYP